MGVTTAAGTILSIADHTSDPSTATFTVIGEVVSVGEFGGTFNEIKHVPLNTRTVQKFKGSKDIGNMTLNLGKDLSDAGQTKAKEAYASDDVYWVRVEYPDKATPTGHGSRETYPARVMSFKTNIQGTDNIIGASCTISLQDEPTETPAT